MQVVLDMKHGKKPRLEDVSVSTLSVEEDKRDFVNVHEDTDQFLSSVNEDNNKEAALLNNDKGECQFAVSPINAEDEEEFYDCDEDTLTMLNSNDDSDNTVVSVPQENIPKVDLCSTFNDEPLFDDNEWVPLSTLNSIPQTPMLNKIGITNPSPSAYFYLDILARNRKILFDSKVDETYKEFENNVSQLTLSFANCSEITSSLEDLEYFIDAEFNAIKIGTAMLTGPTAEVEQNIAASKQKRGLKRSIKETTVGFTDNTEPVVEPRSKKYCKINIPRWRI